MRLPRRLMDGMRAGWRRSSAGMQAMGGTVAGAVAQGGRAATAAAGEAATIAAMPLSRWRVLRDMLNGGLVVASTAEALGLRDQVPPAGRSGCLLRSTIQPDGDTTLTIDHKVREWSADLAGRLLNAHLDRVEAALRPLRHLRATIATLWGALTAIGFGAWVYWSDILTALGLS